MPGTHASLYLYILFFPFPSITTQTTLYKLNHCYAARILAGEISRSDTAGVEGWGVMEMIGRSV